MNADRSINGIYSLIIGVAVGTLLAAAIPEVFQQLIDIMNKKINTIALIDTFKVSSLGLIKSSAFAWVKLN
ncbi:hypothetical protein P8815_18315 [Bacillus altitudinis]|uniref:hypothetical protein n=1 Tax=Bacillus TaxID=1386 RepID=UPI0012DBCD16|nr:MULTISPECIES: hypothetical protein [Bacillus]MEC0473696.1 hypothetical protein [Bacillus altitudinis]